MAIEVNKLVTTFEFKLGSGIRQYEQTLRRLDRQGTTTVNNMGRAMNRSLSSVARGIDQNFGAAFRNVQRQANALRLRGTVTVDNSQAKGKIKEVDNAASGLMKKLGGIALGVGGSLAIGGMAKDFGQNLFNAVGTKQANMGRLTTLMGGKEQAQQIYNWLRDFGAVTPFEKNDLIAGFSSIKGSGYQLTQADLTAIGDVTSGSNKQFSDMIEMLKSANRGLGNMVDNFDGMKAKSEGGVLTMQRFDKKLKKWISQDFEQGDMKGIVQFVAEHGRRNYQGEMARQSATIPGLLSTAKDNATTLLEDIGNSGMEKTLTNIMVKMTAFTKNIEPQAKKFGKWLSEGIDKALPSVEKLMHNIPYLLDEIKKNAPLAAGALALFGTAKLGANVMAIGKGLWSAVTGIKSLGMLLGGWPMLVGALVLGIGYLGWEVYRFATTGKGLLKDLSDQFPGMGDELKEIGDIFNEWKPQIDLTLETLKILAVDGLEALGKTGIDVLRYWIIPAIIAMGETWDDWWAGYQIIGDGFNQYMEDWKSGMDTAGQAFKDWQQNGTNSINLIMEKLDPLIKMFQGLGTAIGNVWNQVTGGMFGGGGALPSGGSINNQLQADLLNATRNVRTFKGQCLNAVWKMQQIALKGTSKITAYHAADAADQMATDKRFQEIKVTRQMLEDPKYRDMLNGATVFYDRQSGFSPVSGHTEIWDMINHTANYGLGPTPLNRSDQMLAHARAFIPVQQANQTVTMQSGAMGATQSAGGKASMQAPQATVTFNYYGSGNAAQLQQYVKGGVEQALTSSTSKYAKSTTRS